MNRKLIYALSAILFVGCAVKSASQYIGSISTNATGIKTDLASARPHTDPTGQVHLDNADKKTDAILKDAKQAQQSVSTQAAEYKKLNDKYVALDNSFPVWAWRWCVRWAWIIGSGFVLLSVGARFLMPLSGVWGITGTEINSFLPAQNPFDWVEKLITKPKTTGA